MGELSKLPNIAVKLEAQLTDVGITTVDELKRVGSCEAWLRILAKDPSACLMRLSSLEGAIQGVRWHYLHDDTKKSLKEFYQQHKPPQRKPKRAFCEKCGTMYAISRSITDLWETDMKNALVGRRKEKEDLLND